MCVYNLKLKEEILARDGKVVFRPDSGKPKDIICGTAKILKGELTEENVHTLMGGFRIQTVVFLHDGRYYSARYNNGTVTWNPIDPLPEHKGAIRILWEMFGGTLTPNGYKQLNPKVGLIYGDGITLEVQLDIFEELAEAGFASTNIVLGIGSFTAQYITRDSLGFAIKATYAEVITEEIIDRHPMDDVPEKDKVTKGYNLFKAPKTDTGIKHSAKGLLAVHMNEEHMLVLKEQCSWEEEREGLLQTVFEDGKVINFTTLEDIRRRVDSYL
jgi:nicotinamide phosphoribosyltransferase